MLHFARVANTGGNHTVHFRSEMPKRNPEMVEPRTLTVTDVSSSEVEAQLQEVNSKEAAYLLILYIIL